MKKLFSMFTAVLLSAAAFQAFGQEQEWVNYSNITAVTDVEPVGDHLWITAKGGVVDMNTTTLEKLITKKVMPAYHLHWWSRWPLMLLQEQSGLALTMQVWLNGMVKTGYPTITRLTF